MKLRYLLTILITLVSSLPVIALGLWVAHTAFEREKSEVRERHLLLASNINAALDRYARDIVAAFDTMITVAEAGQPLAGMGDLGRRLDFIHFSLIDRSGAIAKQHAWTVATVETLDPAMLNTVRDWANSGTVYTPVHDRQDTGPVIGLTRTLADGRIAFAQVSTAYIVQLQQAVAFGERGHAAIVDQFGNVIGHPNPDWRAQIKNIAQVRPVAAMLRGESGVTTFFSPAMKKDMIAGYTAVPATGWGVMVPQPIEELQAKANEVRLIAFVLGFVALVGAAILSWALAGLVTEPVDNVVRAARSIATGDLNARAKQPSSLTPREFHQLAEGFNNMAARIGSDQVSMMRAVEAAQMADRAKSTFLANMSHEFRTPLNAIIGFSDAIRTEIAGPLGNERYRDYVRDINSSGEHLLNIVNDILDLSKIEAGKFELGSELIDLPAMMAGAVKLTQSRAEQADLMLISEFDNDLPPVRGSEVKLKQVIVNLLSNAIKFTPAGGTVALRAAVIDPYTIELRITDSGVGMAEDDIQLALTPFTQVDNELSRSHEGTGLGLPLSKRLVELHGGSFTLRSTPGHGTDVIIQLPVCRVVDTAEEPHRPQAQSAA